MTSLRHTLQQTAINIKVEHTVFALPFAYLGLFLANKQFPGWQPLILVTVAMVAARTAAMSFNRYLDRHFDARNPRTSIRPIPAGTLSAKSVLIVGLVSLVILVVAAGLLNPLCLLLSPIAVIALSGYSYMKRFTWLCHFGLGFTDAIAPAGGWLAVDPHFRPAMLLLAGAVGIWIAGFDLIYACQDVDFDRKEGLHSLPARFSIATSLLVAKICHVAMISLLLAVGVLLSLSWPFYVGVAAAAGLLVYEHSLINPRDLSKIDIAFFNVNSYIAGVLFLFTLTSLYVGN
ncbi:4-hydroxybenzoate octaprenyltransferase [Herpetosiphon geysericola]|uniref:4-hydroxybenzoate polyprenyltransferase n=1 Tax=Herpetosiphon geysericola TaxID=70996 RepID=A0A0P6XWR7_9CHLR|nr:4-hydroxybenzoate octaprenyltransferase [Herpetosiphon geysericola]KPL88151.1 prenyltransferase [Herpetosiphon geysericola]